MKYDNKHQEKLKIHVCPLCGYMVTESQYFQAKFDYKCRCGQQNLSDFNSKMI